MKHICTENKQIFIWILERSGHYETGHWLGIKMEVCLWDSFGRRKQKPGPESE